MSRPPRFASRRGFGLQSGRARKDEDGGSGLKNRWQGFWRRDWFVGATVSALFLLAWALGMPFLRGVELGLYDFGVNAAAQPPEDEIALVTIDDDAIDRIGRWPWSRAKLADLVGRLDAAGARVIGLDVLLTDPAPKPKGVEAQLKVAELLEREGKVKQARRVRAEALALDEDRALAQAIAHAGRVVLPMFFDPGEARGKPGKLPAYLKRNAIAEVAGAGEFEPVEARRIRYPFARIGEAAAGIGHINTLLDDDGTARRELLAFEYFGEFYPSMSLVLAVRALNLTMRDVELDPGFGLRLGNLAVPTDGKFFVRPSFWLDVTGESFPRFSAYDVLADKVAPGVFRDKVVLVGVTATGVGNRVPTPVAAQMDGVEYLAHVLRSILSESVFVHPRWASWAELLALLLVAAYLTGLLPRLGAGMAVVASVVLLLLLVGGELGTLIGARMWMQWTPAALLLVVGHVLLTTKRYFLVEEQKEKVSAETAETNKMLGLSFQSQGMLDMAFEKFRKVPLDDDMMEILYNLALDYERKRQFSKAVSVYEYMAEHDPNYKDIQTRMERARTAGETMVFGASLSGGSAGTLLLTGGARPTLGRYEIIKELGRGAMGTVYLGRDPKINREVAIKTMALSQEFEEDELAEVKERFFREAETAGRLNHPNIVTIYDAGEEHDLAYIAMEYLEGTDLTPFTKPGKLLPKVAVLKVVGKVAEALDYAHGQGVVHRDIKPANIMLLRKNKTVKVTDFGIARITTSSKTKTGVVLGTPSYMSPEQLAGRRVDGRSDLFSLGVMLYEMLAGRRPFKGDSMATLMFQIANEPHPDIREFWPEAPRSVVALIDKALAKDPKQRFQTGREMVRAILVALREMQSRAQKGASR